MGIIFFPEVGLLPCILTRARFSLSGRAEINATRKYRDWLEGGLSTPQKNSSSVDIIICPVTINPFDQGVRSFLRVRFCDPRSYGFFDAKETQNPKKDYFVMTRQAGGTQYIYQNDISLVLP